MSRRELPPPGGGDDLTALLRSRHGVAAAAPPASEDPFTPRPVDPSSVTGTDAERLAAFEDAIDQAREAAGRTLKASRARFVVEAGTALRAIRDEGLFRMAHETFEEYIGTRWGMDRSRAYQLIDAAPVMLVMSKIFGAAPVESHARILAPVLAGHGEPAVREIVTVVRTTGGKITAATIRSAADRLGYTPPTPPATGGTEDDGLPTEHTPEQARALVRLEQGLAVLRGAHRALRGRVVPDAVAADPVRGSELVATVADLAARIGRLTR